eukprot:m.48932 g.48932  ORF g.48932 m.48932 type:complete len:438 (+) comp7425_c0_seq2:163-1476(+)
MGSVEGVLMVLLLLGSAALVVYQSTTSPSCCLPVIARLKRNTIISKDFIDYVIRRGLPTVIVPAGEEEDPIFEFLPPSFNLHFLKTNVGSHRIPVKYSNNRGFLYYNVEQPLSNPASEACGLNIPIPDYNEAKATFKTIFNDSKWVGDGAHRYCGGPKSVMLPTEMSAQLEETPMRLFSHQEIHSQQTSDSQDTPFNVNVWIGNDMTTALLHYDTSHNFYFMVEGSKSFSLLRKSAINDIPWYPSVSSLYRQAVLGSSPEIIQDRLFNVTLHHGQILFLPPYWSHQVVSHGWSLAMNVWSDSKLYRKFDKCFLLPLPFESSWDHDYLRATAMLYLNRLIRRLQFNASIFNHLYAQRYQPIDLEKAKRCEKFTCPSSSTSKVFSMHIKKNLEGHISCFSSDSVIEKDIQLLYLYNFIEHVLLMVGNHEFVSLLRCCLI